MVDNDNLALDDLHLYARKLEKLDDVALAQATAGWREGTHNIVYAPMKSHAEPARRLSASRGSRSGSASPV